jgi:glycosyltransferase involved in cell wall biosynthesis
MANSPSPAPKSGGILKRLKGKIFKCVVEDYWMRIEVLRQYEPRPVRWDFLPKARLPDSRLPRIGIVTPSRNQGDYLESTLRSVLDQGYPQLDYVVQDGGSTDASPEIIARHASRLAHWESAPDRGQTEAISKGFARIAGRLGPGDAMAWLNSDDILAPGALRYVGEYLEGHPDVDALYGHRMIIDDQAREIGRWIMPRHDPRVIGWVDYVPQETLFWRKRAWDRVGGLDPAFQFAMDWDLLARFTQAGLRIVRVPRFLGGFRVHEAQKTSRHLHSTGAEEMSRIRGRFHGAEAANDWKLINEWARRVRFRGALTARLHSIGIRI